MQTEEGAALQIEAARERTNRVLEEVTELNRVREAAKGKARRTHTHTHTHRGRLRSTDTGYRNRQFGYAQIRKWHA